MAARWHLVALTLILGGPGCASVHAASPTPRSPSLDYPPSEIQTSDGYVVGADRLPPRDELVQGARVGTRGTTPVVLPSDGPATPEGQSKPQPPEPPRPGQSVQTPDPACAQIGLQNGAGQPACKGK